MVTTATLYQRLGGEQLVSAMLTELLDRIWEDDQINHHFVGLEKKLIRYRFISYFSTYILDGPQSYIGPSLKTAHKGMQITSEEYEIAISHLRMTLKNHSASKEDVAKIEACIRIIKPHIVNQ